MAAQHADVTQSHLLASLSPVCACSKNRNPKPSRGELEPLLSRTGSACTQCWAGLHSLKRGCLKSDNLFKREVTSASLGRWKKAEWGLSAGCPVRNICRGQVWDVGREALSFWGWHWGTIALLFGKMLIFKCLEHLHELWWSDLVLRSKSSSWLKGGITKKWSFLVLTHEQEWPRVETGA